MVFRDNTQALILVMAVIVPSKPIRLRLTIKNNKSPANWLGFCYFMMKTYFTSGKENLI
jgi:hypothetical protein